MFVPTFEVVGIVTLSKSYKYYGENDENGDDKNVNSLSGDVIDAAISQLGVDFSKYVLPASDANHPAGVPLMAMLYAGPGEATESRETGADYLWPCMWDYHMDDVGNGEYAGLHFNSFFIGNELYTDRTLAGIGTFCHEFGHALGLPDFYVTDFSYTGDFAFCLWSVMDMGCGVNDEHTPIGYTAYEKSYMGWLELKEIGDAEQVTLQSPSGAGENSAYIIRASDTETFIFENRQPDTWYPAFMGSGVMVSRFAYDKDQWLDNTLNNIQSAKRGIIVTADRISFQDFDDVTPSNLFGNGGNRINALRTLSGEYQAVNLTNIVKNDDGTITLFFDPNATAIHSSSHDDALSHNIYTLQGTLAGRDCQHLQPGIYITNGKKMVVK